MATRKLVIFAVLVVCVHTVSGQTARAKCDVTTVADDEFQFSFRFDPGGDTSITKIAFYNSSESVDFSTPLIDSPAQCVDTTLDSGVFELGFSVDGDLVPLPCGIVKSGNTYNITVAINGSTNSAFAFQCITGSGGNINNFPTTLNITNFSSETDIHKLAVIDNAKSLRLQVVLAGGNSVPVQSAALGEEIKIRALLDLNNGNFQDGTSYDNWGRVFHVVFLDHTSSTYSLQFITRQLGTTVRVSGSLSTDPFSNYYPIKRDEERTITDIPSAYIHSASPTEWNTTKRAIKVEVLDPGEFVAVQVTSRLGTNAGSYMVLPDDVLGMKYNCYTGGDSQENGQCLVYAVYDSTTVTIDFRLSYTGPIFINGVNHAGSEASVTMDENDVLNIQCNDECAPLQITANKKIGVVVGHENATIKNTDTLTDFYVSQLPPVETYGNKFVLVGGSLFGSAVQYQIILENPLDRVDHVRPVGTTSGVSSGTYITDVTTTVEEITFSTPVLLLMTSNDITPFTMPYPALHQWSIQNYFFASPGVTYLGVLVARTGDIANIQYIDTNSATSFGTTTLAAIAASTSTSVQAVTGISGSGAYEYFTIAITGTGSGLVELKSGALHRPFMFIIQPNISAATNIQHMTVGTRFGRIIPCSNSSTRVSPFGNTINSVPGNQVDDDCDGLVDEEINDNRDTDGDGLVDEDLAPRKPRSELGMFVDELVVSNNPRFSSAGTDVTFVLITNGCAARTSGSLSQVQPFTWVTTLSSPIFDQYFVVETPSFGAFFFNTGSVYFRARVGFCVGDLSDTRCNRSCAADLGRRRRQADETAVIQTRLDRLDINVVVDNLNTPESTCSMNKLYWIPAGLVLMTILTEAMTMGVVLLRRATAKRYF